MNRWVSLFSRTMVTAAIAAGLSVCYPLVAENIPSCQRTCEFGSWTFTLKERLQCHIYWEYSRTWIVSTLKGRKNKYLQSEVLTIQGAFNGIA